MLVAVGMLGPEGGSVGDGVVQYVEQLAIGVAGGVIGASILRGVLRAMPRLESIVLVATAASVPLKGAALPLVARASARDSVGAIA